MLPDVPIHAANHLYGLTTLNKQKSSHVYVSVDCANNTHETRRQNIILCCSLKLWNELPISIKNGLSTSTFKPSCKTFLFNQV